MSSENPAERRKKMEVVRWTTLMGDLMVAIVFVAFAGSIGDIAYVVAVILVAMGLVYFVLWPRIFRSTYARE